MKYFLSGITVLLLFSVVSYLGAAKLYTWTDESGTLHITEKPPPENAKLKNVLKYQSEPDKDVLKSERRQAAEVKKEIKAMQIKKARQARINADRAIREANEARVKADEAARRAKEYFETHATNQYMRRAYKYELKKAAADAKAAEEQAREAAKRAFEADRRAKLAEEQLKETGSND